MVRFASDLKVTTLLHKSQIERTQIMMQLSKVQNHFIRYLQVGDGAKKRFWRARRGRHEHKVSVPDFLFRLARRFGGRHPGERGPIGAAGRGGLSLRPRKNPDRYPA